MDTTQSQASPKRTRRSAEQWHAILNEHFATDEAPQELAKRLNCALSTVEMQMKAVTAPASVRRPAKSTTGFVEVRQDAPVPDAACGQTALRLRTADGVVAEFSHLPPARYLAEALGLAR